MSVRGAQVVSARKNLNFGVSADEQQDFHFSQSRRGRIFAVAMLRLAVEFPSGSGITWVRTILAAALRLEEIGVHNRRDQSAELHEVVSELFRLLVFQAMPYGLDGIATPVCGGSCFGLWTHSGATGGVAGFLICIDIRVHLRCSALDQPCETRNV